MRKSLLSLNSSLFLCETRTQRISSHVQSVPNVLSVSQMLDFLSFFLLEANSRKGLVFPTVLKTVMYIVGTDQIFVDWMKRAKPSQLFNSFFCSLSLGNMSLFSKSLELRKTCLTFKRYLGMAEMMEVISRSRLKKCVQGGPEGEVAPDSTYLSSHYLFLTKRLKITVQERK